MSSHIISGAQQASLDDEVIRRCCALCAETASRLIETLHKGLDTLYRSSGWHSVYFTFSAAMVLLAACKCPDVSITVKDPSFEADWDRCLFIMHHYENQISSATRAIEVLETIKQQVTALDTQKQCKSHSPIQIALTLISTRHRHPPSLRYDPVPLRNECPAACDARRTAHHDGGLSTGIPRLHPAIRSGQHVRGLVRAAASKPRLARSASNAALQHPLIAHTNIRCTYNVAM